MKKYIVYIEMTCNEGILKEEFSNCEDAIKCYDTWKNRKCCFCKKKCNYLKLTEYIVEEERDIIRHWPTKKNKGKARCLLCNKTNITFHLVKKIYNDTYNKTDHFTRIIKICPTCYKKYNIKEYNCKGK